MTIVDNYRANLKLLGFDDVEAYTDEELFNVINAWAGTEVRDQFDNVLDAIQLGIKYDENGGQI